MSNLNLDKTITISKEEFVKVGAKLATEETFKKGFAYGIMISDVVRSLMKKLFDEDEQASA